MILDTCRRFLPTSGLPGWPPAGRTGPAGQARARWAGRGPNRPHPSAAESCPYTKPDSAPERPLKGLRRRRRELPNAKLGPLVGAPRRVMASLMIRRPRRPRPAAAPTCREKAVSAETPRRSRRAETIPTRCLPRRRRRRRGTFPPNLLLAGRRSRRHISP